MLARALVLLCLVVQLVDAAPEYPRKASKSADPQLAAAEQLWTEAVNEGDPAQASVAWERAAEAFIDVADAGKVTKPEQAAAAHAALLALKNALAVDPKLKVPGSDPSVDPDKLPSPRPIPLREQKLLHVIEVYRKFDSTSDDAIGAMFLRANLLRRHDHLDEAIAAFLEILANHRTHEVAEYSANLLLDSYNRLRKYDELVALGEKLRADTKFLANRPELAETVGRIHVQSLRWRAEVMEKTAKQGRDLTLYDRCGELYLAIHDDSLGARDDEVLYNALACFHAAGSIQHALSAADLLRRQHPQSRLVPRTLGRVIVIESQIARFGEAAAAAEELLARYPAEQETLRVAEDAVRWRVAIGDLDRAARDVDLVIKLAGWRGRRVAIAGSLFVIEAMLAAGKRREATKRALVVVPFVSKLDANDLTPVRAARVLADAGCAVALVDGLCLGARDRTLTATARAMLGRIKGSDDLADLAAQRTLDLELEKVLAERRPDARAVADLEARYQALTRGRHPTARIAAHARLGRLARHAGTIADTHFEACVVEARAALVGEWLRVCERELVALKLPVDALHERLAPPRSSFVISTEGPIER